MLLDRFARRWSASTELRPRDELRAAIGLLAICAIVFAIGVPHLRRFGHDVFLPLDGGWRVLNGQRPVVDFLATMGPAWYLLYAGGLAAANHSADGLGWASGFVALTVAAWSFLLLRRKMATAPFYCACVFLLVLATAPFPIGYAPWDSSFAMTYNRQGFALMGILLLECFLPSPPDDSPAAKFGGGFSTGLACSILLFLKISYGLVALATAGFSVLLRPKEGKRLLGMTAGAAVFALPMLAYLRFDVGALIRENRLLAAVRGRDIQPASFLKRLVNDRYEIAPMLLAAAATGLFPGIALRRRVTVALGCVTAAGAGTLLILGNAQPSGQPLMAVAAMLVMNELTLAVGSGRVDAPRASALLCLSLMAVILPMVVDAHGIAYALAGKVLHRSAGSHLREPHLAGLTFISAGGIAEELNENGEPLVRFTEDGLDLLRAHARPDESVRGMAGTTPFAYAMLRRPSNGGAVSITDRKLSEEVTPPLRDLIGDVDLMLVPKFVSTVKDTLDILYRHYPGLLGGDYTRVAESEYWILYRKRAVR